MNPQASNLCSVVFSNGTALPSTLVNNIVVWITNYYVFDAEDAFTNILTTYQEQPPHPCEASSLASGNIRWPAWWAERHV